MRVHISVRSILVGTAAALTPSPAAIDNVAIGGAVLLSTSTVRL